MPIDGEASTDGCYQLNGKLVPAKNYRVTRPRVCALCKNFGAGDGSGWCKRPIAPGSDRSSVTFDLGDQFQWMSTCDLWQEAD